MQSLLVEAGPGLATALLRMDLADRLALFIAPKLVGGRRAVDNLFVARMADARTFETHRWESVGPDMLFFGYRRAV
jgi:diaminohydroxyphosphoribosylaminopyrimidine deaminase/5-amino-6-(5-phosphoribosylamino)uracil reductase